MDSKKAYARGKLNFLIICCIKKLFRNRTDILNIFVCYHFQGKSVALANKRHAPITFDSDGGKAKKKRDSNSGGGGGGGGGQGSSEQRFYKTPSGKYSGKVSNYSNNSRQRNNNRNNQGKNKNFRKY